MAKSVKNFRYDFLLIEPLRAVPLRLPLKNRSECIRWVLQRGLERVTEYDIPVKEPDLSGRMCLLLEPEMLQQVYQTATNWGTTDNKVLRACLREGVMVVPWLEEDFERYFLLRAKKQGMYYHG
jgi:hypothetical protein